jgi:hypothetical protein
MGQKVLGSMARGYHASRESVGGSGCSLRFAPCMPEAERIVALGFRYWTIGLCTGDLGAWERAWTLYSGLFGAVAARHSVGCLSRWVGRIGVTACRDLEVFPESCRSFCRDECIAVSLIAACQHHTMPAARASAFALVESPSVDEVVVEASAFAQSLAMLEHWLAPESILLKAACQWPVRTAIQ